MSTQQIESDQYSKLYNTFKAYSSFIVIALSQIKEFPGVTDSKFPYCDFYDKFIKHLIDSASYVYPTCDKCETLIIITPNTKNVTVNATISYTIGKETTQVSRQIKNISIVKLPPNLSIAELNLQSNEVSFSYVTVFIDSTVKTRIILKLVKWNNNNLQNTNIYLIKICLYV